MWLRHKPLVLNLFIILQINVSIYVYVTYIHIQSVELKQGDVLPSCFSSYTVNKCPFYNMFNASFLKLLFFKIYPMHSA